MLGRLHYTNAIAYVLRAQNYEQKALEYHQALAVLNEDHVDLGDAWLEVISLQNLAAELDSEAQKHINQALALASQAANEGALEASSLQNLQALQNDYAAHKQAIADAYLALADSLNLGGEVTEYQASLATAQAALAAAQLAYDSLAEQAAIFNHNEAQQAKAQYETLIDSTDRVYYWRAGSFDASGRLTQSIYGNGLITHSDYNQATGHLDAIRTGFLLDDLRKWEYTYDAEDNVLSRVEAVNGYTEYFSYDALHRMVDADVAIDNPHQPYRTRFKPYKYDAQGNFTYVDISGNYQYNSSKPHAVTHVDKFGAYGYDANGNMISGRGRTWVWSSFNKPTYISRSGHSVELEYGPNRNRVKQVATLSGEQPVTTYYAGAYERVVESDGTTRHKNSIYAGDLMVALMTQTDTELDIHYLHQDNVGSVDMISNLNGTVNSYQIFAPFGNRRIQVAHPDFEPGGMTTLGELLNNANRGFGGHEELPGVGIIHMNGRVYDPVLRRFASPDPFIQAPTNTQSYNRYSYVINNPLKYTDPSGYIFAESFIINVVIASLITTAGYYAFENSPGSTGAGSGDGQTAGPLGSSLFSFGQARDEGRPLVQSVNDFMFSLAQQVPGGGDVSTGSSDGRFVGVGVEDLGDYAGSRTISATTGGTASDEAGGYFANGAQSFSFSMAQNNSDALRDYFENLDGGAIAYEIAIAVLPGGEFVACATRGGCSAVDWLISILSIVPVGKLVGAVIKIDRAAIKLLKKAIKAYKKRKAANKALRQCFVAGTLVHTKEGTKPIEEVEEGDLVASKNDQTGEIEWKPVVQLFENPDKVILNISFETVLGDTETLGVTEEHPFWVEGQGWTNAEELEAGDQITTLERGTVTVSTIATAAERQTTYNFEVEDSHTYFVGESALWVHNMCIEIPSNATETLEHIKRTGNAPPGYKGGRTFKNDGRGGGEQLPQTDASGNPITYKEYDINPYKKGVNRGAERLVVGSDGSSYYTGDHYRTFNPIK